MERYVVFECYTCIFLIQLRTHWPSLPVKKYLRTCCIHSVCPSSSTFLFAVTGAHTGTSIKLLAILIILVSTETVAASLHTSILVTLKFTNSISIIKIVGQWSLKRNKRNQEALQHTWDAELSNSFLSNAVT